MASASDYQTSPSRPIGIDLGTTYSCVAVCEDGKVTVIKNDLGVTTTPSHIAFSDSTQTNSVSPIIVGDAAKNQANVNPENAIFDVKRIIGRKFNDPDLQKDIKQWPFKVINVDNSPLIEVQGSTFHPEQISAKVLVYLKKQAEAHLSCRVTDAVITVPAYFNDGQRQATKDAGAIAGLNVLQIMNEPTAAAIAYNHQLQNQTAVPGTDPNKAKTVLIFDLGGGTFDLALLTMKGQQITVIAVDGDAHLGGQDFDNELVDYCVKEFEKKHKIDLSKGNPNESNAALKKFSAYKCLRRIKNECEIKKVNLSSTKIVPISIEAICGELDMSMKIKREKFESINQHLFDKCISFVDRILKDASVAKEDIDDVVLVGGSSRIPKIQQMLKNFFDGKQPLQSIKQDEAVAYGAAVVASRFNPAASISTTTKRESDEVLFTDVIPLAIGVQVYAEKENDSDFSTILKKNTAVPATVTKQYRTVAQNQRVVKISIYEGQSHKVKDNHLLGEFHLTSLPHNSSGEIIEVRMDVNHEGILTVTAQCPGSKTAKNITVNALKGRLGKEKVEEFRLQEMYSTKVRW